MCKMMISADVCFIFLTFLFFGMLGGGGGGGGLKGQKIAQN